MLDALIAEARIRWGLDPAAGIVIAAAERLASTPIEPSRPLLVVTLRLLRSDAEASSEQLPGRHSVAAAGPIDVLRRLYPAGHPVGRLGAVDGLTVADLAPEHLAGPLYLGPVAPETAVASPWAMPWIADRLRRPDGCPWDREQTHESLRKNLLEEAYEVYDALEGGSTQDLAEELGDLYLQIVLHAQIAAEAGVFDLTEVQAAIGSKIVRRHPHVFGDAVAATAGDVNRQWEQIKKGEREAAAATADAIAAKAGAATDASGATAPAEVRSALDGVPRSMPALAASQEMQERAAHLGYDWPEIVGIVAKIHEEMAELEAAVTDAERHEEVGDLLLVTVNLARRHGVDAESALRSASAKFRRRFRIVERLARERGVLLRDMSFAELDQLWDAAKAEERAASRASQGEEEAGQ